jgi:hypothetical protein
MNQQIQDFKVSDLPSFAKFIELLREDYMNNPATWENKSIDDFLEAMSRYALDIQGYYDNTQQKVDASDASWKTFADILIGASMYE